VRPVLPRVQRKLTIPLRITPSWYSASAIVGSGASQVIDQIRSCALRLAFKVSSVGAWGATAGTVKLLLPPRQSRGISLVIRPPFFESGWRGLPNWDCAAEAHFNAVRIELAQLTHFSRAMRRKQATIIT
jgi:hypothetical protein